VLGFAAQGLLSDQRIWSHCPGVDFIDHQVVELEHVDLPHHHALGEGFSGAAVVESGLPVQSDKAVRTVLPMGIQHPFVGGHGPAHFFDLNAAGLVQQFEDAVFAQAVEDGGSDVDAKDFGGPSGVGFKDLSHVHA